LDSIVLIEVVWRNPWVEVKTAMSLQIFKHAECLHRNLTVVTPLCGAVPDPAQCGGGGFAWWQAGDARGSYAPAGGVGGKAPDRAASRCLVGIRPLLQHTLFQPALPERSSV